MKSSIRRRLAAMGAAGACCLGLAQTALGVGDVVISQVWGGTASATGTAGAPNADYVELFNRTANPISLSGWSINVDTPTGSSWTKLDLPAVSIAPFSYYLIQVSAAATAGNPINADVPFTAPSFTELSSTTGKVALRNTTTPIGAVVCPPFDANLIDLVTYGTSGTCREGSTNAPPGSLTAPFAAVFRNADGCVDTDENGADFTAMIPNPRNSSSPSTGGCLFGACCNNTTGACSLATSAGCAAAGGAYQGDGTSCTINPCPPAGACCAGATGSTCSVLTASGCAGISGFYQGDGILCSPNPCSTIACCFADGTCCNFLPALCTSLGGTVGSVTCTAVGNCTTAPANDLCSAATVITAGTTYVGNNWSATTTGDGLNTLSVTTRSTKGVWYSFTPAATSVFDIVGCGSTFDAELQVFIIGSCSDTTTWSYVAADDDRCTGGTTEPGSCNASGSSTAPLITGIQLNAGQTYHIRVNLHGSSATGGGNFHLLVSDVGGVTGACCNATTGQCEIRTPAGCTTNAPVGVYQGDGVTCSPSPCATIVGACCFSGGVCVLRPITSCTGTNIYQGDNTSCAPDPCITGACCSSSGTCTITLPTGCTATGSTYQGDDTVCTPSPCPPSGSCCNPCTFACLTRVETQCFSPDTWTLGGVCSPNPCGSGAPPANDEACNAVALSAGIPVVGQVGTALLNDGIDSTCQASAGKGVWYSFQPAASGYHAITTCGTTFDDVLAVFTGACADPFALTEVDCDDDTCAGSEPAPCGTGSGSSLGAEIPFVFLNAGTNYLIRVQAASVTAAGGTFPITINSTFAGACCNNTTGACTLRLAGACTASETYQGDNSVCDPTPCPASGSCCNDCTFACTTTVQSVCGAGSTWTQGGVCSPNPCIAIAAPANDAPCNAIALTLDTQLTGTLASATGGNSDEGPAGACQTNGNKGVWYSFTPSVTGDYTISTCGATFDSILTLFTGDCGTPASFVEAGCDDDTCIGGASDPVVCGTGSSSTVAAILPVVNLTQGVTYYIRVQVFSTGTGGTFPISVRPAISGACCTPAGTCTSTLQSLCVSPNVWINGAACAPTPCPVSGACCDTCGGCTVTFASTCVVGYQGDGSVCTPNPCLAGGVPNDNCASATVLGASFPYFDSGCNAIATNDGPGGSCDSFAPVGMDNSVWYVFTPTTSGQLDVTVDSGTDFALQIITIHATTGACPTDTSTEVGCSTADPAIFSIAAVAGTSYYICIGDEGTGDDGGSFTLSVNFPPTNGACCTGSACSLTTAAACVGANTSFAGAGTACNAIGNPITPCCKADYNQSGGVTVQDIFDFLAGYFSNSPYADANASGGVTVQDIFDYLSAYFSGGC